MKVMKTELKKSGRQQLNISILKNNLTFSLLLLVDEVSDKKLSMAYLCHCAL